MWMADSLSGWTATELATLFTAATKPRCMRQAALQEVLVAEWVSALKSGTAACDTFTSALTCVTGNWLWNVTVHHGSDSSMAKAALLGFCGLVNVAPLPFSEDGADFVAAWVGFLLSSLTQFGVGCIDATHACVQSLESLLVRTAKAQESATAAAETLPRIRAKIARALSDVLAVLRLHMGSKRAVRGLLPDSLHVLQLVVCDMDAVSSSGVAGFVTDCLHVYRECTRGNCRISRMCMTVLEQLLQGGVTAAGVLPLVPQILEDVHVIAQAQASNCFVVNRVAAVAKAVVPLCGAHSGTGVTEGVLAFVPPLAAAMHRFAEDKAVVSQCAAFFAGLGAHAAVSSPEVVAAARAGFMCTVTSRPRESWSDEWCPEFGVALRAFCEYYCSLARHFGNWATVMPLAPALVDAARQGLEVSAQCSSSKAVVTACAQCFAWLTAFCRGHADMKSLLDGGVVLWALSVLERRKEFGDAAVAGCMKVLAALDGLKMLTPSVVASVVARAHEVLTDSCPPAGVMVAPLHADGAAAVYGCMQVLRLGIQSSSDTVRTMSRAVTTLPLLGCVSRRCSTVHEGKGATVELLQCLVLLSTRTSDVLGLAFGAKCVETVLLGPLGGSVEVAEQCAAVLDRLADDTLELTEAAAVAATLGPIRRLLERFGSDAAVARHCMAAVCSLTAVSANRPAVMKELPLLSATAARHTDGAVCAAWSRITAFLSGGRHGGVGGGGPPLAKAPRVAESAAGASEV
jgi:hypothetical protein